MTISKWKNTSFLIDSKELQMLSSVNFTIVQPHPGSTRWLLKSKKAAPLKTRSIILTKKFRFQWLSKVLFGNLGCGVRQNNTKTEKMQKRNIGKNSKIEFGNVCLKNKKIYRIKETNRGSKKAVFVPNALHKKHRNLETIFQGSGRLALNEKQKIIRNRNICQTYCFKHISRDARWHNKYNLGDLPDTSIRIIWINDILVLDWDS